MVVSSDRFSLSKPYETRKIVFFVSNNLDQPSYPRKHRKDVKNNGFLRSQVGLVGLVRGPRAYGADGGVCLACLFCVCRWPSQLRSPHRASPFWHSPLPPPNIGKEMFKNMGLGVFVVVLFVCFLKCFSSVNGLSVSGKPGS